MRNTSYLRVSLLMALSFAFASLLVPRADAAQNISETAMAGPYSVTLKVLPAESFSGPKAAMVRDNGSEPNLLNGPMHPNHHMVAFVSKSGKPMENAKVAIRYRSLSSKMNKWMTLPVARMHVAGKGPATTHYGNNLMLAPGDYQVRVTVDGSKPAMFRITVAS